MHKICVKLTISIILGGILSLAPYTLSAQTIGAAMQDELDKSEFSERSSDRFWSDLNEKYIEKIRIFDLSAVSVTFSQPTLAEFQYQEEVARSVSEKYRTVCGTRPQNNCNSQLSAFFQEGKFNGKVFNVVVTIALNPKFAAEIDGFLSSAAKSSYLMRAPTEDGPSVVFSTNPTPENRVEFRVAVRAPQKDSGAAAKLAKTGNVKIDRDMAVLGSVIGATTTKAYTGYDLPDIRDATIIDRIFNSNAHARKTQRSIGIVSSDDIAIPSIAANLESADLVSVGHYEKWGQDRYQVIVNQFLQKEVLIVVPADRISKIDRFIAK
jgi:hypothetical protein